MSKMYGVLSVAFAILGLNTLQVGAQAAPPLALEQPNTYAAEPGSALYNASSTIIGASGLDIQTQQSVQVAVDFTESNWATGSVFSDPFYSLPSNASTAQPGDVLQVEEETNVTLYTLPPNVALSRFIYQTETLNGTSVPATAFVLWPWMVRKFPRCSGAPLVAWAHGTSGVRPECAPSHMQGLLYDYKAPFTLALQGYAVVGVDYAGQGINETADGMPIPHQWAANPAGANDLFYAVEAAQKAWPSELSNDFVIMGHSQGGGVAWGAAARQVEKPVPGYLGSIAGSPLADVSAFATLPLALVGPFVSYLATGVASVFPQDFDSSDWLTPAGLALDSLEEQLSGCQSIHLELFNTPGVDYAIEGSLSSTWYLNAFNKLVSVIGKPIAGPMLVLQGTADSQVPFMLADSEVNATCSAVPTSDLEYAIFEGADHVPTLFASQQLWLDWIAARFSGQPTAGKCTSQIYSPAREVSSYQEETNYYLERPLYAYETA